MKLVSEMTIKNRGMGSEKVELFQKVTGAMFCKKCGNQYNENEINEGCPSCKSKEFISGNFAATLAGYIKLAKDGKIKEYYKARFTRDLKSSISLSKNRMIFWLLTQDGYFYVGDKKTEEFLHKVIWRKW